ncbi:MAG TPA: hypothetical protein VGR62_19625 [Candidatus Binatia bacterium]|nr:hypothetical protein [Candidatus Binatia bacterium]
MIAGGLAKHDEVSTDVVDDAPKAQAPSSVMRRIDGVLGLLTLYLVVMAILTWPLVTSIGTHHLLSWWGTPFDLYQGAWAMAWQTDVLFHRSAVMADANIYFPDHGALFFGQTGWGALPLFAPAYLLTRNPTYAINLTFLFGVALTACGIHLVVRRWTGSTIAGGVAAATFVTNPWMTTWFGPTAPQWAALMWLPWIALVASRRPMCVVDAVWLALLVALQMLTDPVYLLPGLLVPLGVHAVMRIARAETRADGLRMAAAMACAALLMIPFLLPYLRVSAANPDLAKQTNWADTFAAIPLSSGHSMYVAPITALLLLVGIGCVLFRGRREQGAVPGAWATASVWALVGFLLALPPNLVIGGVGGWRFPTPMGVLQALIPATATLRASSRLAVAGLIGLAMLSGLAFAAIHRLVVARIHDRQVLGVVTVALMALYLSTLVDTSFGGDARWPRNLKEAPTIPPSFELFLRLPRRSLLQLPLGARDGTPAPHAVAMYRSIGRWYSLINGYASYWPKDFPSRMRLARHVPDPDATQELVRRAGLGFVWVDLPLFTRHERKRWDRLIARGGNGLMLVAKTQDSVLYLVAPTR